MLKSCKLYVSLFVLSSAILTTSVFAQATSASDNNKTTAGTTGSSNTPSEKVQYSDISPPQSTTGSTNRAINESGVSVKTTNKKCVPTDSHEC